ncbi:hypothetical protein [Novacetimonas cocois]|nr:hypothetical protein [Novacetimonas cocois]
MTERHRDIAPAVIPLGGRHAGPDYWSGHLVIIVMATLCVITLFVVQ